MKESELRQHADCSICGEKIGRCTFPRFRVLRIETYLLDLEALERQQGLTMQLGGHAALAQVMGPDEDLANQIGDTVTITVCEECANTKELPPLGVLIEQHDKTQDEEE